MKTASRLSLAIAVTFGLAFTASAKTPDGKPCILLLAGKPSHGPGQHEHNAGVKLLAKCLYQGAPEVVTKVHLNSEWPNADELAQADTIVIYSDGGGGHVALQGGGERLADLAREMKRGCGLVCLHYAVEPMFEKVGWPEPQNGPDGKPLKQEIPAGRGSNGKGAPEMQEWLGGYFEQFWSVNPHWTANFKELPKHPISNGVKPFSTNDEWYFHMRFRAGMKGVTPILSDVPPPETMNRGEGTHNGNPDVKREVIEEKKPQHVAWAVERADGGRGFGFTGGHFHNGWGNNDQRKLVLNAIAWTAKVEVPAQGVESNVTEEDLAANLDPKPAPAPKPAAVPPAAAPPAANASVQPLYTSAVVHDKAIDIKADLKGAKELYLAVSDAGDGLVADWAVWLNPTLIKGDGSKVNLTDLKPKSAQVGWGAFAPNRNPQGQAIKINGKEAANGFSAHAPSLAGFDLPEGVVAFEAQGAIDDGGTKQGNGATVKFQLFAANPGPAAVAPSAPAGGGAGDRYGLEKAKANMATFKTPDGLKASLFAAEPMIQNPTNIDIDPRGRVWAVECLNYRKYLETRPEGDRVVILEDTNGDGEADTAKTFFQDKELTNPLGICVLPQPKGTKVIVSAAPWVWLLTDADGDDVAEDAKKIFKIGGVWNYDHQIHAFVFGPDGKFYFNSGNSITDLNFPDGTRVKDMAGNEITNKGQPYRGGMVFRCDIDLETGKATNIETLGHNFRNNYEVGVDSFGAMWQSDNDDDGNKGVRINYVMEFGNYGYGDELTGAGWQTPRVNIEKEIPLRHWHQNDPGVVPNLLQTGQGSPTGILVNEGTALGPQFTNQLIHCDAGPRTTRAYPVTPDGAGYKAEMIDILTSSDSWYRVSDCAIAPDGSLVIADWYDPGVGGHAMGDHEPGKIMGRIYRVAATDAKSAAPKPDFTTAAGAAQALTSPNLPTQSAAWNALHAMGAKAEPELLALFKSENPRIRARALGVLARIKGRELQHLRAGLADADENVRIAAIRLATTLERSNVIDTSPLDEDRAFVGKLLRDTPAVRRQIALSLYRSKKIEPLWVALAQQHDGKDRWYLEALGIGAIGNEDACFDAWLAAVGDKWNTPAGRDIIWRMRSAKAAGLLAKIIQDQSVPESEKPRYMRSYDFLPESAEKTNALVQLAGLGGDMNAIAIEALTRVKNANADEYPGVKVALDKQLAASAGTIRFVEIVRDFGLKGQGTAVLDTALKNLQNPLASEALKLVLDDPKAGEILDAALSGPQAEAVVTLLGTSSAPRTVNALTKIASTPTNPLPRRVAAIQALARSQTGAQAIIQLAKNNELPADLKSAATAALNLVQYPALKADIAALFPAPAALGGQPLSPIAELVKIKGDLARGKTIAERAESSCVTCHRIGDKGVDFAPALSEIGSKLPKEALFDAIINPNSGVSMGFETTQLETRDGTVAIGIVRSETNDELVLALPGGATNSFAKKQIAKREKLATSLMPSGLNQALSQQDLVDLVEYLVSLKKP
jgi:putative membrane-bound dehydrogenase-like protein